MFYCFCGQAANQTGGEEDQPIRRTGPRTRLLLPNDKLKPPYTKQYHSGELGAGSYSTEVLNVCILLLLLKPPALETLPGKFKI